LAKQLIQFPISHMQRIATSFFSRAFVKSVLYTGSGIASAHLIALLAQPLLTRVYSPEVYGVMASYTAIAAILIPFSTLSYGTAIVIAKDDWEVAALMKLIRLIGLSTSAILLLVIIIVTFFEFHLVSEDIPTLVLFLIPLAVYFAAHNASLNQFAIRTGNFKHKAKAHVLKSFSINAAQLLFGVINPVVLSLLIFKALEGLINNVFLIANKKFRLIVKTLPAPSKEDLKFVAKSYKDFPLFRAPQSLLNAFSIQLPVLALTYFSDSSTVGQFSLAFLMLGAPLMLLATAFVEVFYGKISAEINSNSERVASLILRAALILLAVGIFIFSPIFIFGEQIFILIFGDSWGEAGNFASAMVFWFVSSLMSRPAVSAIPSLRLESHLLAYEVIAVTLRGGLLFISFSHNASAVNAILYLSCLNALLYVVIFVYVYFQAQIRVNENRLSDS
tara:strand:+ start:11169 stop:12509 length:1341 start_codon:yes stop_codon:yes gene_type:complete